MTVKLRNGAVITVNDSYGARLLGQGAKLAKDETRKVAGVDSVREKRKPAMKMEVQTEVGDQCVAQGTDI